MNKLTIAGFDPPSTSNMGWAIIQVKNGIGTLSDHGVFSLPPDETERLLSIQSFTIDLCEKWNLDKMCFERSIGGGDSVTRERIGENTGIIKLIAASFNIDMIAINTNTMAKVWTGFGGSVDKHGVSKKSRTKRMARDVFFPGQTFKSISQTSDGKENFEHLADAIGVAACHLLQNNIPVGSDHMVVLPTS